MIWPVLLLTQVVLAATGTELAGFGGGWVWAGFPVNQ